MSAEIAQNRWTNKYPELGTGPVPIEPYISPEFFARERERIFRKVWLNVARVEEIPQPGDYIVKDIGILKTSVIVVRGRDGVIRAFHNMCSHRGNKVAIDSHGSKSVFTCFFHGWSYGLDGRLRGVADEAAFFGLCKKDLGLTSIAADVWEGFVFINVDPHPSQSLVEFLGDYGKRIQGYPFAASTAAYSWQTEMNVNWKIAKDAFAEAYHVKALHRRSVASSLSGDSNPFVRALSFDTYGPHQSMSIPGNAGAKPTATSALAAKYGAGMKRYQMAAGMESYPPGVNPTRRPEWVFELTTIFPNMNVHIFRNNFTTYNFWPLAVDRTLWEVKQYYAPAANAGEAFAQEVQRVLFRDTVLEDLGTLERTQQMLGSGAKSHFVLSDEELLVRRFLKLVEDYVN